MSAPFYVNVSSKYGAPMGRHGTKIDDGATVYLQRVPMVDGDYDPGGAYWGSGDAKTGYVFCAWTDDGGEEYFRARDREAAKAKLALRRFTYRQATADPSYLDSFVEAYAAAALWSTNDESAPSGGSLLDANYGTSDIARELRESMRADCERFIREAGDTLDDTDAEQAGHDLWLTRNRYGVGFWDRPNVYSEARAKALTKIAQGFGEVSLYVGDDGKIYCY